MKHKIINLLLVLGLTIPTIAISGCQCENRLEFRRTMFIHTGEGKFTQDYMDRHNLDEGVSVAYPHTNMTTYDDILKNNEIPTASQLIPPENKAFGGWYFTNDYKVGDNVNRERIEAILNDTTNNDSFSIHAKWIENTNNAFFININNSKMEYTDEYKSLHNKAITNRVISFETKDSNLTSTNMDELIANLATFDDFVNEDYVYEFAGWYLDETYETKLTSENILSLHENGIHCFNIVAKWNEYPKVVVAFSEYTNDLYPNERIIDPENANRKTASFKFKDELSNPAYTSFAYDPAMEFTLSMTLDDLIFYLPKYEDFADDDRNLTPNEAYRHYKKDYELVWYITINEKEYTKVDKKELEHKFNSYPTYYYTKDSNGNYINVTETDEYNPNIDYYVIYNKTRVRLTQDNLKKAIKNAQYYEDDNSFVFYATAKWYLKDNQ